MVSTGANCKGQGYPLCEKNAKCPVQDAGAERESSWKYFVRHPVWLGFMAPVNEPMNDVMKSDYW